MKPTLLITNDHRDITGGGTYVMMILNILKKSLTLSKMQLFKNVKK